MKVDHANPFALQMANYLQQGLQQGLADADAGASFTDAVAQMVVQGGAQSEKTEAASSDTSDKEEPSLIERIREKGFVAFVDDLQQEKIKELRKKILASMGYSEEDLKAMSPEQRAQIEDIVDNELLKRMMAAAALKDQGEGQGQGKDLVGIVQKTKIHVSVTSVATHTTSLHGGGLLQGQMGLGPLLAQQEIDAQDAAREHGERETVLGKKDREKIA